MTWAEFMIRSMAYNRTEKNAWKKVRAVAYQTYVSNWFSKKKPKTIEKYMPIDENPGEVTDLMKEVMERERKKYLELKAKQNG